MCHCNSKAAIEKRNAPGVFLESGGKLFTPGKYFSAASLATFSPTMLSLPMMHVVFAVQRNFPGTGMQPPGRCSKARYGKLRREVIRHCKGNKSRCTGAQDCKTLNDNHTRNINCANARRHLNRACFKGGDQGHKAAAATARIAAARCKRIAKRKGCD